MFHFFEKFVYAVAPACILWGGGKVAGLHAGVLWPQEQMSAHARHVLGRHLVRTQQGHDLPIAAGRGFPKIFKIKVAMAKPWLDRSLCDYRVIGLRSEGDLLEDLCGEK
jgi:hypothetical protein